MKLRVIRLTGPHKGITVAYPKTEAENLVATGQAAWAPPEGEVAPPPVVEEKKAPRKTATKRAR